jgi:hypothetical protein
MADLDVGRDGIVWGCTANSQQIVIRKGITPDEISGTSWEDSTPLNVGCTNIAVCTSGHVWAVDQSGQLMFRQGIMASSMD